MSATNVVVITGGSRGLGKELARLFVAQECAVVVCAPESNRVELEAMAKEVGAYAWVADVAHEADVRALAQYASSLGHVDVWINNAAVWMPHCPVEGLDMLRVREMFAVNVLGTIAGSKEALAIMRKKGGGTIINIASTSALSGRPTSSAYCASKWAVRGFTESLRAECAGSGVRVMSVFPDRMHTALFDEQKPDDFAYYLSPAFVAETICTHLRQEHSDDNLVIRNNTSK